MIFLAFLLFIIIPVSFAGDNNTLIKAGGDIETLEAGDIDNVSLSNDNDVLNAGDVYFDASASSDGDGTQSRPYKTLNSGRLSGSTNYHFAPGQYSISSAPYSSMFGQSEMNIIGTNPEKTIIQYTGSGNFLSGGTYSFTGITLKNINIVSNSISATNTIFDSAKAVVEPETSGNYNYGNSYGGAVKISSSGSGSSFYDDLWNLFNQSGSSSSDIKFDNCVFRNNNTAYGGAFYIDGATVTITNSNSNQIMHRMAAEQSQL